MINLETATKLVEEGIDDIFRKAMVIGKAESGDITPQEVDVLEDITLTLAKFMKEIINTNQ